MEIHVDSEFHVVTMEVSGTLTDADYKKFMPQFEEVIGRVGRVRMLVDMRDFHGWDLGAAWDDFKFGTQHARDIARLAMVGEKRWQEWIARAGAVFMKAPVKYFAQDQRAEALAWLKQ
jgi:hypothetical protein